MDRATSDVRATLARALVDLRSPGLVCAYLFGSHAAGRAHRESDIDVAVLLEWEAFPTARARFEERLKLSTLLGGALGTSQIDLVVLNDAPPLLARHIVTAGTRILCSDPEREHAFVRDVQLRAADIEPFLRRTRQLKFATVRR
ncbi:MAG: nucleotidyltransferase domain-containing protein [Candidatus Rokuibacteriota bacterium]